MKIWFLSSSGIAGAFSSRDFSLFTAGNSMSVVGIWLQRLAAGWLAWELTRSGFWVGAVAFADTFPSLVVGPFAGVLADRWDRRVILFIGKSLQCLQGAALAVLVGFEIASIEAVFGLMLFGGIAVGIMQPARLAIIPSLVRREHLAPAVAINSIVGSLARFVGPALAGVLIAGFGVTAAFAAAALGQLVFVMTVLAIRPVAETELQRHGVFGDLVDGFRYVRHNIAVRRLVGIEVLIGMCARPIVDLLPGFAGAVFDRGAGGLATLAASVGIGAIVGGLWLAQRSSVRGLTTITLGTVGSAGAIIIVFAATDWFWLGVILMGGLGAAMTLTSAGTQILVQSAVAGHMRGRVLGIWGLTHRGVSSIGSLILGWLVVFWGFDPPAAASGLLCLIAALFMFRHRATLAHLLDNPSQSIVSKLEANKAPDL